MINIKVNNLSYQVTVEDLGIFRTKINEDDWVSAKSLSELKRKLKGVRGDLNLPCTRVYGRWHEDDLKIKDGTVTGIHSGNGNILIKWDDGSTGQEQYRNNLSRRLTKEEVAEVTRLHKAMKAADKAYDDFLDSRVLDIPVA